MKSRLRTTATGTTIRKKIIIAGSFTSVVTMGLLLGSARLGLFAMIPNLIPLGMTLGLMGMMVQPQWGGAGSDTVSYVIAIEELSRVDASHGVIMSVNNSLVCNILEKFGTEDQKKRYLIPLA